jgi:23S rRNA (pseudouridine1915-N3)-methyltransferase
VKVRVAWFGRPASGAYEQQVSRYLDRVRHRWPAEDVALRPTSGGRDRDPARALAAEADAARRRLPEGWPLVALDERGRPMTSSDFAGRLAAFQDRGAEGVAFLIGSDLGIHSSLRGRADLLLSLGPMTLPHELARLVLWEQLFRASDILGGGGYHRPGSP